MDSGSGDRSELVSEEERVEQDELNTHEIMATLTQLLTHMERNKINPIVEEVAMSATIVILINVFYLFRAVNPVNCHRG